MNAATPVLAAMLTLDLVANVGAQEAPPADKAPVRAPRFFDRPIDYWRRGTAEPKVPDSPSDWGQVVKLPDGTLAYHELPKPLVRVLEDPSRENIQMYFEWRMSRAKKILRAAELMKEYKGAAAPETPASDARPQADALVLAPPEATAAPPPEPEPFTVTYFHKQGCPPCDSQDAILAEWLKRRPQGKLAVIEFGTRPELWRAYQVRGTPSLVVEDAKSKKSVFLEGLSRGEALDGALEECQRSRESNSTKKEK